MFYARYYEHIYAGIMRHNADIMTEIDFSERYSRQIRLPLVGAAGQRKLLESRVLIIGLGGLGSPVAMYLTAAGIGKLTLADFDRVEVSNLQRQIIHRHDDLGELKATSAARTLRGINPAVTLTTLDYSMDYHDFLAQAADADLMVDCTDNFPTRFEMNRVSLETNTPLVSAAAIRWEGQITSFDPRAPNSPCYRCLYPDENITSTTCESEGVIAPLVGVIGTMQAMEAVNILLGFGQLAGVVWLFDAHAMEWQRMRLPKNPECTACGRIDEEAAQGESSQAKDEAKQTQDH